MRFACTLVVAVVCAVASAQSKPRCLIGQTLDENGLARYELANRLAEALDAIGQVESVTYGIDDPIFRAEYLEGKVSKPAKQPKEKELLQAAKSIGAIYVVWIEAKDQQIPSREGLKGGVSSQLTLYKNGKKIWTDDQVQLIVNQLNSMDETCKSIAASHATRLSVEPWKEHRKQPKLTPTDIGKGQSPIIPETKDDDPILNDFVAVQDQVKTLILAGRVNAAEILLRDAIDAAPKEPARRLALINFLREYNLTDEAVSATISASIALGDPTLSTTAARILLDVGRKQEAAQMINDALAASPNHEPVRILSAELRMREANPAQAMKHLEVALRGAQSAEVFYMRAICRGLLGAEDGVRLDLQRCLKEDPSITSTLYTRCASILDDAMTIEGPDLHALFQKALLNKKSEEVADSIDAQERLAKAVLVLLGENSPNAKYDKSHASRVLAFHLLIQTLSELKQYIATGQEDALTDARIDLGECIRTIAVAREQFAKECKDASTTVSGRTF